MSITVKSISELAGAMEITKYPNSPLIKSESDNSVLVIFDGDVEYILGYITKGDTSNTITIYSQLFSGNYGHVLNDIYNNIQNSDDVGATQSKKERTVLVGENKFIGSVFHDGIIDTHYGFNNSGFYRFKDRPNHVAQEAPVAPTLTDEVDYTLLDGGNKIYHSSSGSLQEFNAVRINIGNSGTDIHSYGIWDETLLSVETPIVRSVRSMAGIAYASGSRSGTAGAFPEPNTYHIFNYEDNSSFMMGKGIIEMEKSNDDNTVFAKTVFNSGGVLVEVDSTSKVRLVVNATTLLIEEGQVRITGADINYDGDLYVSGKIVVSGTSTFIEATDIQTSLDVVSGKVIVNAAGKFLTTAGIVACVFAAPALSFSTRVTIDSPAFKPITVMTPQPSVSNAIPSFIPKTKSTSTVVL